jgi:hypothetical protein
MSKHKFFQLVHPGAPRGIVRSRSGLKMRKQDRRAKSDEMYAVVFFPKITGIGKAQIGFYSLRDTLSATPEAAKARFMDGIARGEKWETYHDAGHRIRRVKVIDMGDA